MRSREPGEGGYTVSSPASTSAAVISLQLVQHLQAQCEVSGEINGMTFRCSFRYT